MLIDGDQNLLPIDNATFETLVKRGDVEGVSQEPNGHLPAPARQVLNETSRKDIETANSRYQAILPYLEVSHTPGNDMSRSIRRWISNYRHADISYGYGYIGLIPRSSRRGNRTAKVDTNDKQLMLDFIKGDYETFTQKSIRASYIKYKKRIEDGGGTPLSYKTYSVAAKSRDQYQQTKKRKGKRAAYQVRPQTQLIANELNQAQFPFDQAHIDHTQLDEELASSITGQAIGRPWLTLMVDDFSRRILAHYLTFDPPSYRSCMAVMRECVRRHGRLPKTIIVDNGAEFNSVYFESFLARYECHKKSIPPGQPRNNSVGERVFSTLNTTFLYNLIGNTQLTKQPRQVTKSVNPKNLAIWTFSQFQERLAEWCYEVYDTLQHEELKMSPREAFERSVAETGLRMSRFIAYTQDFVISTLPSTPRGVAKIQPNKGVLINYIWYWHDAFRSPKVINTKVPVRYDPFDMSVGYAFVEGRWVKCLSQYASRFSGYTEKEIRFATAEIRRLCQLKGTRESINARTLATFLEKIESDEAYQLQHLRSHEMRLARQGITIDAKPVVLSASPQSTTNSEMDEEPGDDYVINDDELELMEDF
jgi:putative transposase